MSWPSEWNRGRAFMFSASMSVDSFHSTEAWSNGIGRTEGFFELDVASPRGTEHCMSWSNLFMAPKASL